MSDHTPKENSPPTPRGPDNLELDYLRARFDGLLERMQQPGARAAIDRALRATPEEMGHAAIEAARGTRPILMRHRIRLGAEVQTAPDLAAHFRDRAWRVHDDVALAAALNAAADGLDAGRPPGRIASAFETQAARASEFTASAPRGVAEALRRIEGPVDRP